MPRDIYDAYHMNRKIKTSADEPFPYTEVSSARPGANPSKLSDDLLNWLAWKFVDPEGWGWVFRGMRKRDYRLKSTLDRRIEDRTRFRAVGSHPEVGVETAETYLLGQFKKAAHHFSEASAAPDRNTLEWLALMQHYGAPTRLLDFTRSPYIACFFALEEVLKNRTVKKKHRKSQKIEKCAIWAIDTHWLIANSRRRVPMKWRGRKNKDSLLDSEFTAENFDDLFAHRGKPLVLPVVPPRSNPRLLVQQGLFLCPGVADIGFEENLASYRHDAPNMSEHAFKIIIEGRIRTDVLFELRLMNISQASLFPGLQGYATSLANELEFRSSDEITRLR